MGAGRIRVESLNGVQHCIPFLLSVYQWVLEGSELNLSTGFNIAFPFYWQSMGAGRIRVESLNGFQHCIPSFDDNTENGRLSYS